jgi:hypothetical protein
MDRINGSNGTTTNWEKVRLNGVQQKSVKGALWMAPKRSKVRRKAVTKLPADLIRKRELRKVADAIAAKVVGTIAKRVPLRKNRQVVLDNVVELLGRQWLGNFKSWDGKMITAEQLASEAKARSFSQQQWQQNKHRGIKVRR